MPRTSTGAGVTVTSRVLSILGSFDAEHPSLTLTEIAQRAGLTLPTAHRLVGELTAWGALRRTSRGRYVIGRRMWDLGLLAPVQTGLREVASPFLHDLYGATLATVHLAVRDGARALYLDCVSGHASVPVVSKAGSRLPLHSTGVGKVLLAHAPARLRHEVLAAPLYRFTPYTVIQPGRLASQLQRVAHDGYATTAEEMTLGACSIALPVRVAERTVASLGVVVPDLDRRAVLMPAMRLAAKGIARSVSDQLSGPQLSCGCGMGWGPGSHRGGVAWACRWNPAPSAAPRARCGRRTGVSLVACAPWSRRAALGSGGRAVVARPSGRWPPRPRGGGGEGAARRLGTRREVLRRAVGPAFDRSRP
ncbi:MAG TPA: IclR family transcriptional regulator, partial [Solirubrobacteraceae bacterium]